MCESSQAVEKRGATKASHTHNEENWYLNKTVSVLSVYFVDFTYAEEIFAHDGRGLEPADKSRPRAGC